MFIRETHSLEYHCLLGSIFFTFNEVLVLNGLSKPIVTMQQRRKGNMLGGLKGDNDETKSARSIVSINGSYKRTADKEPSS